MTSLLDTNVLVRHFTGAPAEQAQRATAFPLLVLALTNSPFQAGVAGALDTLPVLVIGLPAGALVDRWDRKRVAIVIVCDTGRGLNLASIRSGTRSG